MLKYKSRKTVTKRSLQSSCQKIWTVRKLRMRQGVNVTTSPRDSAEGGCEGVGSRSDCQLIDTTGRCLLLCDTWLVDTSIKPSPPYIPETTLSPSATLVGSPIRAMFNCNPPFSVSLEPNITILVSFDR